MECRTCTYSNGDITVHLQIHSTTPESDEAVWISSVVDEVMQLCDEQLQAIPVYDTEVGGNAHGDGPSRNVTEVRYMYCLQLYDWLNIMDVVKVADQRGYCMEL